MQIANQTTVAKVAKVLTKIIHYLIIIFPADIHKRRLPYSCRGLENQVANQGK